MRHCDARHRRTADVIVGDQEGVGDLAQYADLVTDMRHVRSGRWFDLADDLERPFRHRSTIRRVPVGVPRPPDEPLSGAEGVHARQPTGGRDAPRRRQPASGGSLDLPVWAPPEWSGRGLRGQSDC